MEKKIIFDRKKLQEDLNSLPKRIDKLNEAIDAKSYCINELKREFDQLKSIHKMVNGFNFKIFESTAFIYSVERGMEELDIIIKVESLNRELIKEMKEENNISE